MVLPPVSLSELDGEVALASNISGHFVGEPSGLQMG